MRLDAGLRVEDLALRDAGRVVEDRRRVVDHRGGGRGHARTAARLDVERVTGGGGVAREQRCEGGGGRDPDEACGLHFVKSPGHGSAPVARNVAACVWAFVVMASPSAVALGGARRKPCRLLVGADVAFEAVASLGELVTVERRLAAEARRRRDEVAVGAHDEREVRDVRDRLVTLDELDERLAVRVRRRARRSPA